jgi:hypothetical protein
MNNLPAYPLLSLNSLNSEMGSTCPVVFVEYGETNFLPPGTITMTTYNGTLSPAGDLYGRGASMRACLPMV